MFIDSHAHIYAEEFKDDRHDMLMRAFDNGVSKILMPNVDHTSIDGMLTLNDKYPSQCIPMMGLHPCYVQKDFNKELYLVEEWLNKRTFCAVGEIGLDLYWDKSLLEEQTEALKIQVELAIKNKLPIVIHSREATREVLDVLHDFQGKELKGVFHCFSGTIEEAKEIIDMGFYLGIGGVVTFKNGGLDKILPTVELSNIILETDAPYLAPVPYRGKRNEPLYIPIIATKIAEYMNTSIEEVAFITTNNCNQLFNL